MNNQHLNATNKNDPARLVLVRALVPKNKKIKYHIPCGKQAGNLNTPLMLICLQVTSGTC